MTGITGITGILPVLTLTNNFFSIVGTSVGKMPVMPVCP